MDIGLGVLVWMIVGCFVSLVNLRRGLLRGHLLHAWWYMPIGFLAVAAVWPWAVYELLKGRVI